MMAPAAAGDRREGEITAWRNLLWDSVRMLHAGRPDLARRFRAAAHEIEQQLKTVQARHPPAGSGSSRPG